MKIYTRKGDGGKTSLIGGTRVPKHHLRIEAYGTVDELNSWMGLLRDQIKDKQVLSLLLEIQDRLFTIGSLLAADPEHSRMKLPELSAQDIQVLEKEIDRMDSLLPEMKSFVLPGGNVLVSNCHITRCVCRRAERLVVHLSETDALPEYVLAYLNRLSDYLFVLSRFLAQESGAEEIPWQARI